MLPFSNLFIASALALIPISNADSVDWLKLLPRDEKVNMHKLSNGVMALVHENPFPSRGAALRVVVHSVSHEDAVYSLDTSIDDMDAINEFFELCKEKCQSGVNPQGVSVEDRNRFCGLQFNEDPIGSLSYADNLAVIAVGDFSSSIMQDLIENYFGSMVFQPSLKDKDLPIQIDLSSLPSGVALHIDYPVEKMAMGSYADMKENWLNIFAQDLLQQRMERLTRALRENWVHPHPRFIFPVHGFALASEDRSSDVLSILLWEIEQIKLDGFNENEFLTIQERTKYHLNYLARNFQTAESSKIASFYADGVRSGNEIPSYESFIAASEEIVPSLRFQDLKPYVRKMLQNANRFIHVRYPDNHRMHRLTASDVEEMVEKIEELAEFESEAYYDDDDIMLLNQSVKPKASARNGVKVDSSQNAADLILRVDNPSPSPGSSESEVDLFSTLPLTSSERDTITYIITNMAEKNIFELAFEKKKMEKKGDSINHVHPLRFIGHIFSSPDLKRNIKRIKKSSFKWDAFMDGFSKRMKTESSQNNLLKYVDGFAKQVNANPEKITYYIQKKDWEGLVRYLM